MSFVVHLIKIRSNIFRNNQAITAPVADIGATLNNKSKYCSIFRLCSFGYKIFIFQKNSNKYNIKNAYFI
jgi:hypothetical protein